MLNTTRNGLNTRKDYADDYDNDESRTSTRTSMYKGDHSTYQEYRFQDHSIRSFISFISVFRCRFYANYSEIMQQKTIELCNSSCALEENRQRHIFTDELSVNVSINHFSQKKNH